MPFVQAKCPNCGGILAVDNANDAAVCQFCNTPFIVEKAITNYNITNNVTVGEGGVVNIIGAQEPEESKLIVRLGTFKGAALYKFDIVGLFDENNNKVLSLNLNETKTIKVDKTMRLTAFHLKPNGSKQTFLGIDRKLMSQTLVIEPGRVSRLDIQFSTSAGVNKLVMNYVDMFI